MKIKRKTVSEKPALSRLASSRELLTPGVVDRESRALRGYSVITLGEAEGHGLWIDEVFLDSVVESGNASVRGVKSRFTHPGLSGDGLGTALGRSKDFERENGKVLADLLFLKSASRGPKGDLAAYVMDLGEEAPDMFGASIVFERDFGEEMRFQGEHSDEDGEFRSPDEGNKKNLRHARLSRLVGSDVVDDPAANPDGLFSFTEGNELPAQAEALLLFGLGLTEEVPPEMVGGPHPERVKEFLSGFLERHGLELRPKELEVKEKPIQTSDVSLDEERKKRQLLEQRVKLLEFELERLERRIEIVRRR